jgi:ABC-type nitrate/sulfonate/bicarbonate transport system substrate-binding protein
MKNTLFAARLSCFVAAVCLGVQARAAEPLRVGTPEVTSLAFNILDIADKSGAFAKEGVTIERMDFAGSAKLHPAMAAGSIDLALGSGSDFLFLARGVPEKAIGVYQKLPNDLVLVVRADSDITSLAGLKGKKMGVAGPGGLTLWIGMSAALKQGWATTDITYAYLGTIANIMAALVSKNVDVAVADTGAGYRAEEAGRARVLAPGGAVVDPFIAHLVFASDEAIAKRPEDIKHFLKAFYAAIAFAKTHEAESVEMTAAHSGYTPELSRKVYEIITPQFVTDGHFEPVALAATLHSLVDLGVVTAAELPASDKMINQSLLP